MTLTLSLAVRPLVNLDSDLAVRPRVTWAVVFCSEMLACSDSLVCGEEMTARFYWNTL